MAAVVRVMTYYCRYGVRLDSYWAGQPWSSSQTNHEETIIILRQDHCWFPHVHLLESNPGELTRHRTLHRVPAIGALKWGPGRPWHEDEDWKHPGIQEIEKTGGGEVRWEEMEECKRGELF